MPTKLRLPLFLWLIPFAEVAAAQYLLPITPAAVAAEPFVQRLLMTAPLAALLLLFLYDRERPLAARLRWGTIALNVAALLAYFPLRQDVLLAVALETVAFVSAFFVALSPRDVARRVRGSFSATCACLFAGLSGVIHQMIIPHLWLRLATFSGYCVGMLFRMTGVPVKWVASVDSLFLTHPVISVRVYPECCGLEGIFFLLFELALLLAFDPAILGKRRRSDIVASGVLYMMVLNVLRIFVFVGTAILAGTYLGDEKGRELVLWFFHSGVGWVVYLAGIAVFFRVVMDQRRTGSNVPLS